MTNVQADKQAARRRQRAADVKARLKARRISLTLTEREFDDLKLAMNMGAAVLSGATITIKGRRGAQQAAARIFTLQKKFWRQAEQ